MSVTPTVDIPKGDEGGWITVKVPRPLNVYHINEIECKLTSPSGGSCTVAILDSDQRTFKVTPSLPLWGGDQFVFILVGIFDNPVSTRPTNSFEIGTSVGETMIEGVSLACVPGPIDNVELSPSSKQVGDNDENKL